MGIEKVTRQNKEVDREFVKLAREASTEIDSNIIIGQISNPKSLSNSPIVKELVAIARDGFGTFMTEEDVRNHVLNVDFLHLIYVENTLVGFGSYDVFGYLDKKILYINGIVVKKSIQKRGLAIISLNSAINTNNPDILVARTQNPVIYHLISKYAQEIYPNKDDKPGPLYELCVSVGEYVAISRLDMKKYNKELFFEEGTYSTALNDEIPIIRDSNTIEVFKRLNLNRERGDSIIIVAVVRK